MELELKIAKHEAILKTAKLQWPEIDTTKVRILPIIGLAVTILMPLEHVELEKVDSFMLGYGQKNNVLVVKCQRKEDGYAEPYIVSERIGL